MLPTTDVFCGGQAFLADGRLLAAGGTFGWASPPRASTLRTTTASVPAGSTCRERSGWPRADLNFQPGSNSIGGGRWYPTLVTLENGEVFVVGGHPASDDSYPTNVGDDAKRHNNNTPERYSPGANTWTLMTADITAPDGFAYATDGYPRFHLLPDGMLFSDTAGKDSGNGALSKKRVFDPFAGVWTGPDVAGLDTLPGLRPRQRRHVGAVAVAAAAVPGPDPGVQQREPTAFRIDVDDIPDVGADVGPDRCGRRPLPRERLRHDPADRSGARHRRLARRLGRRRSRRGDPRTRALHPRHRLERRRLLQHRRREWTTIEDPAPNRRGYHSTALLLPDGRVWHGGSTTTAEPIR